MAFTSWAAILLEWKNALADRNMDSFFISSAESGREMRTTYQSFKQIADFTSYLEGKAMEESVGLGNGQIPSAIGGY